MAPQQPPGAKGKIRPHNDTSPDPTPRTFADDSKESTMPKARGADDFSGEDSGNPTDPRAPKL